MIAKNKKIKFISAFLIISILLPAVLLSAPNKGYAFWGVLDVAADTPTNITTGVATGVATTSSAASQLSLLGFKIKDIALELGKQILKHLAKQVLAKMTQATINWINSDFHGSPLFVENPESFFKDIAKSEVRNIVDMIGYDTFRFPFGPQTALNVIASYKSQLATNAQYTLSKVINDPDLLARYRNDFNFGGWNGFLINTQYPQNNYLGFNMLIRQNLASRLEGTLVAPAQKIQSLLQQGMGFLSPQTCPSNPNYNNGANEFLKPTWNDSNYDTSHKFDPNSGASGSLQWSQDKAAAKAAWYDPKGPNMCPGGLVNTTPGSVAAHQVMTALDMPFLTTALDGALGNSLAAIFDALIGHFISKGLNGLSSTINPSPSEDNWSYNGNTFNDSTTISGTVTPGGTLNIPQKVSVNVKETTSTRILGGTMNFSVQPQSNESKAIAIATIDVSGSSGPQLKITAGTTPGTTTVTVQDSSTPNRQTVTITITVGKIGDFKVIPASITTDTNTDNAVTADISGGSGPYSLQTSPNESVAIANVVTGTTSLIVIGTGKGTTSVVVKDSSDPVKTVSVVITITALDNLVITPSTISVNIGEETSLPAISGGIARYFITSQSDTTVATAEILPATPTILTVTGRKAGLTTVAVRDSSSPYKSANIIITTIAPQGSCHLSSNGFEVNQQTDKASCDTAGGTWTANKPLGTCNITTIQTPSACTTATGGIWTPTPPIP